MPTPLDNFPSDAVLQDADAGKAPDPRRHYDSPEELAEDVDLDLATRETLLREWQHDLDRRLDAESEGMSASDPISAGHESRLATEVRRVTNALKLVTDDIARAAEHAAASQA